MENNLLDFVYKAIDETLANIHTITIVKVTGVNATTINCQPVTARKVGNETVPLPEFLDVPPVFMRGGDTHTAHPIAVGDFALLLITERCFDAWYNGQDNVEPNLYRMFDYSDGFALVGISPLAAALQIPSGHVARKGDSQVDGDYTHNGNYVLTGNLIVNGNITVNGGTMNADGIDIKTHRHTGVQTGGGTTGGAVQ